MRKKGGNGPIPIGNFKSVGNYIELVASSPVPANAITDPVGGVAITDPVGGAYITES